jgi:hypothetical protein
VPRTCAPLVLALIGWLIATSCAGAKTLCDRGPAGEVLAFLEGEAGATAFRGEVVAVEPPASSGIAHYVVSDATGERHRIAFRAPGALALPLEAGREYDFAFEYVRGEPAPFSIVVRDDAGLLFAAAGDYDAGGRVLQEGLPELEISLEEVACAPRPDPPCYESIVNLGLRVKRGEASVLLGQGESARIGGFEVRSLVAREIVYTDRCADAGKLGISWVIIRTTG